MTGSWTFWLRAFFASSQQTDLRFEPLAKEPLQICARAGLIEGPMSRAQLNAADWVLPPVGSVLRQEFDALFQRVGMRPPRKVVNAENLLMVTTLVEKDDMLTVLPRDVLAHYARYGMLEEIEVDASIDADLNQGLMAYGIITKTPQQLSPAAASVLELLRDTAQQMGLGHEAAHP